MPEIDPKLRLTRLIAYYRHTILTDYDPSYQKTKAEMLEQLWHRIHALQVEIVGEGI